MGKVASSSSKPSFKDVINNRASPNQAQVPSVVEYIVEKTKLTPCMEMVNSTIGGIFSTYSSQAIVCRFNGLWPKIEQLYRWIHSN